MAGILTVILTGILVVILCTELLVRNLPESIRASMVANCRRLDGSLSRNRQRIERKATNELRRNLAVAFLFVITPVSFLIYWTHASIIPFSIGRDALISFRVSEEKWKESLETSGVEADYDRWRQGKAGGYSREDARLTKQFLWQFWPIVVGVVVAWCIVSFLVVKAVYLGSLRQLARAVEYRSQSSFYRDLSGFPLATGDRVPRDRR